MWPVMGATLQVPLPRSPARGRVHRLGSQPAQGARLSSQLQVPHKHIFNLYIYIYTCISLYIIDSGVGIGLDIGIV